VAQADNCWNHNHPWRHEVLHRDNRLSNEINRDYGHLGGHYGQLMREDASVRRQEIRDARMNGGHLTGREVRHLNREETGIQRQINHDVRY
jgi:hypothetical protein